MDSDILLIDKPTGITSFDVIRRLRRQFNQEGKTIPKMGHAGTLDPLATGLMIVGVGPGTKKLSQYIKLDKQYIAEILVGEKRSTGDLAGEILDKATVEENFSDDYLQTLLSGMVGTLQLPVSAYSAIKKNGVPMYKRARQAAKEGKRITDVPVRTMKIYQAGLLDQQVVEIDSVKKLVVKVCFEVASGTYIRSLAEEFGQRLGKGYPATLKSLRRIKIGNFSIDEARPLD